MGGGFRARNPESHAAALMRALRAEPVPTSLEVARIEARVSRLKSQPGFYRRTSWALAMVVVLGLPALGAATVRLGWVEIPGFTLWPSAKPKHAAPPARPSAISASAWTLPPDPKVEPEQAAAPPVQSAAPTLRPTQPGSEHHRRRHAEAPAKPSESVLGGEARLLSSAIKALREQHRPDLALEWLDQYRAQFPAGTLAYEERFARVEALLSLSRRSQALAVLEELGNEAFQRLPRGRELQLMRGELLAEHKRCGEAIADFEPVLAGAGRQPGLAERALWGRASCRAALSDVEGSRADLRRYLADYPSGRFAEQAESALAR